MGNWIESNQSILQKGATHDDGFNPVRVPTIQVKWSDLIGFLIQVYRVARDWIGLMKVYL